MDLHALQPGYSLAEYRIEKLLGEGGFGLTYLALDTQQDMNVVIKEYMPSGFAVRQDDTTISPKSNDVKADFEWGLNTFITEARMLATFDEPNIVRIHRFFKANGTAYLVMEYCDGASLSSLFTPRNPMTEMEVRSFLNPLMNGLQVIHSQHIFHRDITPSNIMFRNDATPVLIDFGSARKALGDKTKNFTATVTRGYSSSEQYRSETRLSASMDIYSLAAVAYACLTGTRPDDALDRMQEDKLQPLADQPNASDFLKSIDKALSLKAADRPQSIDKWRQSWDVPTETQITDVIHEPNVTNEETEDEEEASYEKPNTETQADAESEAEAEASDEKSMHRDLVTSTTKYTWLRDKIEKLFSFFDVKTKVRFQNDKSDTGDDCLHIVVEIFYATDRNYLLRSAPNECYGTEKAELTYGLTKISIPKIRDIGEIKTPSWWRLIRRSNPAKHFIMESVKPYSHGDFYNLIQIQLKKSQKSNALIYIHGYSSTFEDAAFRTAQMYHDLQFDGAALFYSWPSKGGLAKYTHDQTSAEYTELHLEQFLEDSINNLATQHIYIIAHSMGSKPLTKALVALKRKIPDINNRVSELILAAPDIDSDIFKTQIAPTLMTATKELTIYASSNDVALQASKLVNGDTRLGLAGEHIVLIPGIETIDATDVNTSLIGHSGFSEERPLLNDIFSIIADGNRAKDRFGLEEVNAKKIPYWKFRK